MVGCTEQAWLKHGITSSYLHISVNLIAKIALKKRNLIKVKKMSH